MIPKSVVEKINRGEMTEDEFWIVALNFARVVSEKARGMFRVKEKYDDYIIELLLFKTTSTNRKTVLRPVIELNMSLNVLIVYRQSTSINQPVLQP